MNRRTFLKAASVGLAASPITPVLGYALQPGAQDQSAGNGTGAQNQLHGESPEQILLKDYRPKSIYKIPVTEVAKAKYPIIDMHSHPYAKTPEQIAEWVDNMDQVGVEKTVILTAAVAVLTFRAMTSRDSGRPPSGNLKGVIKPVRAASVSFTTRGEAW